MFVQLQPVPNEQGEKRKKRLFNLALVRSIMPIDEKVTRLYYDGFMDSEDVETPFEWFVGFMVNHQRTDKE